MADFLRDEGFKQLGTIIEITKIIQTNLKFNLKSARVQTFCRSGSRQWPVLMVDGGDHVVALKGHKTENGKLMLNIRDSRVKNPNSSSEIWIDINNSPTNEMDLATQMCVYFELS